MGMQIVQEIWGAWGLCMQGIWARRVCRRYGGHGDCACDMGMQSVQEIWGAWGLCIRYGHGDCADDMAMGIVQGISIHSIAG